MRLLLFAALALGPALRLLAGPSGALAPSGTLVSGHLAHPKSPQVEVAYGYNVLTREAVAVATAQLDGQGNFRLALPGLKAPTEAEFRNGNESTPLFLAPGDDLHLTLDAAKFDETLRYTGRVAAANNYLAETVLKFDVGMAHNPLRQLEASTPAQMRALVDDYRRQRRAFFAAYAARHPVPGIFRAYVRQSADFERADYLLYYGSFHSVRPALNTGALPAGYYDFLAPLRPAQDSALAMNNGQYYGFLEMYGPLPASDPVPTAAALLASTRAQFGAGRSRDLVLARYVYTQFNALDAAQLAPWMATFRELNRDSAMARTLRARYAQAVQILPGHPAPAFTLLNNEGRTVALADLRGKVVYLDFWGTWCHPCLAEIPASLVLRQQFAGRDVVFVYIDVNDKEQKWQQVLAAEHLLGPGGVHLRAPDQQVPAAFQVESYPTYWLIGRDGRIVTPRAPRPSAGAETVAAIEAALKG
ncbi:TlpA family protein disulfide reductase [Hymenobacter caeli]|uniref:Thiol-disulfide isomerase/thioredoxin n=1 Tax=Hymenobacter caeli TaxID=2735894 RepID=A0ABX2FYA0_9BACT|nr:TlpA disulfide reductase family protein [Hymenobacter caeli]NRT21365.1 thiol-disulfide isomerase/thioredoxin [Hymenobacter caeli]